MKNITKLSALLLIAGIVFANNTLIAADGSSDYGKIILLPIDLETAWNDVAHMREPHLVCLLEHKDQRFVYDPKRGMVLIPASQTTPATKNQAPGAVVVPLSLDDAARGSGCDGSGEGMGVVPANKKRFSCEECGMGFAQQDYLTKHKFIHTGEQPFACSKCNTTFARKCNLERHERIYQGRCGGVPMRSNKRAGRVGGAGGPMHSSGRKCRIAASGPY